MASPDREPDGVAEEDLLRADLYDLLAALLARPPSRDLLDRLARLSAEDGEKGAAVDARGDTTPIGSAASVLARLARATTETAARREYEALFVGLGRGELLPYASYYLTGFLHEKPLALVRADMARLGVERSEAVVEPEDGIASLCETMAGLIRGRFGAPASLVTQRDFFAAHIGPWAGHFFDDLARAQSAVLYAPVGALGQAFVDIEKQAFRMGG